MKKKEIPVVYIITKLELGGAQKVCLSLFKNLRQAGYKSFLISGNEGLLTKHVHKDTYTYLIDDLKREVGFKNIINEFKAFFKIFYYLRNLKKNYSKVIVHTHSTKAGIIGRWAAFFARIPERIHTVHGFGFHACQNSIGWVANFILEWTTSFITTHYICVSSADLKTGITYLPFFKTKSSLIRAAIPLAEFQKYMLKNPNPNPLTYNPFVFGTISCFKKQKNLIDLLKAFYECFKKNPHVKLEIIGDGEQRSLLWKWVQLHNLEAQITFHGWQDDVASFMKSWHAFVLSSLWEGLPCAIVEARSLKLPVIAYDTGGIHDIIFHNQNGLLCPLKDYLKLSEALYTISTNTEMYQKFSNYSDDLYQFNEDIMIKQHIKMYKFNKFKTY